VVARHPLVLGQRHDDRNPKGTLLVIFLLTLFATMVHFAHATFSQT
jgi:hypothetical protein